MVVKINTYPGDILDDIINKAKDIINNKNNTINVVSFDFNGVTIFIDNTLNDDDIHLYYDYCLCFDKNANDYESFILKSSLMFTDRKKSLLEIEKDRKRRREEFKIRL